MAAVHPLTRYESRLGELRAFGDRLRRVQLDNDQEFQTLFYEAQLILELPDVAIAEALLVSRPTVNRWIRGKNLPHRALRPAILRWVEAEVSRRTKWLSDQLAGAASEQRLTNLLAAAG